MKLRLSGRAQSDLERTYAYLYANRGAKVADHFLERAQKAAEFIGQNPYAGPHPNWATRHRSLRFWPISGTRFVIYYVPEEESVSIERVLDGRRDVVRILERGIEEAEEDLGD
jgi:plasmid stabilization system protein ParE